MFSSTHNENNDLTNSKWRLTDIKGKLTADSSTLKEKGDEITSLAMGYNGRFIAVGDNDGRISLFHNSKRNSKGLHYKGIFCIGSHSEQLDLLSSKSIRHRINAIAFLNHSANKLRFLCANDTHVKFWSVKENYLHWSSCGGPPRHSKIKSIDDIKLPSCTSKRKSFLAKDEFSYPPCYQGIINSISVCYSDEYFLLSDCIKLSLFSLEKPDSRFDLMHKDPNRDDTLYTCSKFFPNSTSHFMYGTNHGNIKIVDTRISTRFTTSQVEFQRPSDPYTSFISGICGLEACNEYDVISRDYTTVCTWDTRMPSEFNEIYEIHKLNKNSFWKCLCNNCIFDTFDVASSPDGRYLLSGSYENKFHVIDRGKDASTSLINDSGNNLVTSSLLMGENCSDRRYIFQTPIKRCTVDNTIEPEITNLLRNDDLSKVGDLKKYKDYCYPKNIFNSSSEVLQIRKNSQICSVLWHPSENMFVCATKNNLFFYKGDKEYAQYLSNQNIIF